MILAKRDNEDNPCGRTGGHFNPFGIDPTIAHGPGSSMDKYEVGDLSGKYGKLTDLNEFESAYFHDTNLALPELEGTARSMFVVLYEAETDKDSFYSCSKVREVKTKVASAAFGHDSVTGDVTFEQVSPFFPTQSSVRLRNLQNQAGSYHVHEIPMILAKRDNEDNPCGRTGGHFDPFGIDPTIAHGPGSSMDKYEVGDLSGKYGKLTDLNEFESAYFHDTNLALPELEGTARSMFVVLYEAGTDKDS